MFLDAVAGHEKWIEALQSVEDARVAVAFLSNCSACSTVQFVRRFDLPALSAKDGVNACLGSVGDDIPPHGGKTKGDGGGEPTACLQDERFKNIVTADGLRDLRKGGLAKTQKAESKTG